MHGMKGYIAFFMVLLAIGIGAYVLLTRPISQPVSPALKPQYWMLLKRASNIEYLFYGIPNDPKQSTVKKTFTVKAGVPGKKPTPLPSLVGRDYWLITHKLEAFDNEETAPYFLVLDVPVPSAYPHGPQPYLECDGRQCDWELPGYFGLHGVNGDNDRLSLANEGSSGCVRHRDEDITYLYHLFTPEKNPVRYYIVDK